MRPDHHPGLGIIELRTVLIGADLGDNSASIFGRSEFSAGRLRSATLSVVSRAPAARQESATNGEVLTIHTRIDNRCYLANLCPFGHHVVIEVQRLVNDAFSDDSRTIYFQMQGRRQTPAIV
jgi:hypothetical protein